MHDLRALEEEWKKYKRRKSMPYWVLGLFVFISFFSLLSYYLLSHKTVSSYKETSTIIENVPKFTQVIVTPQGKTVEDNKLKNHSLPGAVNEREYVENMHPDLLPDNKIISGSKDTSVHNKHLSQQSNRQLSYHSAPVEPVLEEVEVLSESNRYAFDDESKKSVKLDIIGSQNLSILREIEERYYNAPNVDDALFLARSYYEKGMYDKVELWALEVNKLDETVEESWLLFIKAKLYKGYTNEAKNILLKYIEETDSLHAKRLLQKIE